MQEAGLVAQETTQKGNRPLRQVYRLTEQGEAHFQRLLRDNLAAHASPRFAGDIGLAFIDALEPDEALALLAERRELLAAELDDAQDAPEHEGGLGLVREHQLRHLNAELEWLDDVLSRLAKTAQGA